MLKDAHTFSSFSTNDLATAKEFYGQTLGLNVTENEQMHILELHLGDKAEGMIYPKPDHKPAEFTVLNFVVDDIEAVVDELVAKGVTFEQYDGEYMKTNDKGISQGPPKMAWFKDP